MLTRLLAKRGIHYLVTRYGPWRMRALAFDAKYREGDWAFGASHSQALAAAVWEYARDGDMLILGCGGAAILDDIDAKGLRSVVGVDLSQEALRLASRHECQTVRFVRCDMERYVVDDPVDVVLFSESLYYVAPERRLPFLHRTGLSLKPGGVFVVTIADIDRYQELACSIRDRFRMIEDRALDDTGRRLLVFRPGGDSAVTHTPSRTTPGSQTPGTR